MNLIKGTFIKRYKRFLADIEVDNEVITVHCPNSGSMKGLLSSGAEVWISRSLNPKRKLACTLEIIKSDGAWVGINTQRPNEIVSRAISGNLIKDLSQ